MKDLPLTKNKLLSAQIYPWIADELSKLYYFSESHIRDIDGQIFLVDKMREVDAQNILKYSCLFPNRMIISSGDFFFLKRKEHAHVDIDFFRKLFWSRSLINEGIVHISPFCLRLDLVDGAADYENLKMMNENKVAFLDNCGLGQYPQNDLMRKIHIGIPWLENVQIFDYLDIIKSNKTEFEFLNYHLSKLSSLSENTNYFITTFVDEFKDANINIQIALEKKQASLKTKGVTTILSLCLTVIPLLIPANNVIDPKIISALLGVRNDKRSN